MLATSRTPRRFGSAGRATPPPTPSDRRLPTHTDDLNARTRQRSRNALGARPIVLLWSVLAPRSPTSGRVTAPAPGRPVAPAVTGDGVPVVDMNAVTHVQAILAAVGIDRRYAAWAAARGVAWRDRPESEAAYADTPVSTLRELAADGDREAALALYYALAETAPAESIAGFGRMALDGELDAMLGLATSYSRIASALAAPGGASPELEAVRERFGTLRDLERESLAWLLVFSGYMGYPRSLGATDDDPGFQSSICDRAVALRRQVEDRAVLHGRTTPPVETAPFGMGRTSGEATVAALCPPVRLPAADFSACRPILVRYDGADFDAFVCP